MAIGALDHHLKGLLALDAGNDTDCTGGCFQQRSLLDVQFEIGSGRKAEQSVRHIGKGLVETIERFADADAIGIAHGSNRIHVALASEGLRTHHARSEARALLVHPGDDDEVARGLAALLG